LGHADGPAQCRRRDRAVSLLRRKAADRLHAAEESEWVLVDGDTLLLDDAWQRRRVDEPARQTLNLQYLAPFRETLAAQCGIDQHATGAQQTAEAFESGGRNGEPGQRHDHGGEGE